MNVSLGIILFLGSMLAAWAVLALYVFAPDLFSHLDISDVISGSVIGMLALGGNLSAAKLF